MLCSFVSRTSLQLGPNRFLSSFPNGETRKTRPHHHGDSMMGSKVRCNFRETRAGEVRRLPQPVEKVGIQPIATTNRTPEAPKSSCLVPYAGRKRPPRKFSTASHGPCRATLKP